MRATTAWRYAWISGCSLAAMALSGVILQSQYSLYLAFNPSIFLQQGWAPLAGMVVMCLTGALLDGGRDGPVARAARALLLSMVFVGLFQILRRSLATTLALGFGFKVSLLLGLLALAALATWRLSQRSQWRMAEAGCLAMLVAFALQPGMPAYLLEVAKPLPARVPAPPVPLVKQRVLLVILDEWDLEVSRREGLFGRPEMQELLDHSLFAESTMPSGSSTLSSIPSMLTGKRFGIVMSGGPGYLVSKTGERLDARTTTLVSDLAQAGRSSAVVGFFHDYCRILPQLRTCVAEPVHFFPGWAAGLARALRSSSDLDSVYSDFMLQWRASYERLNTAALAASASADSDLLMLHINVPHPPLINPSAAAARSLADDYRANLDLMLQLIGDLKSRVLATQVPTTMILTSDHWLREKELWGPIYERQVGAGRGLAGKTSDQHVPFIVWFSSAPGNSGVKHAAPFSTTTVRELIPALLGGEVDSPQALSRWLSEHKPGDLSRFSDSSNGSGVH